MRTFTEQTRRSNGRGVGNTTTRLRCVTARRWLVQGAHGECKEAKESLDDRRHGAIGKCTYLPLLKRHALSRSFSAQWTQEKRAQLFVFSSICFLVAGYRCARGATELSTCTCHRTESTHCSVDREQWTVRDALAFVRTGTDCLLMRTPLLNGTNAEEWRRRRH